MLPTTDKAPENRELQKSKGETMLPTDKALVEDRLFIKYVELYSEVTAKELETLCYCFD